MASIKSIILGIGTGNLLANLTIGVITDGLGVGLICRPVTKLSIACEGAYDAKTASEGRADFFHYSK